MTAISVLLDRPGASSDINEAFDLVTRYVGLGVADLAPFNGATVSRNAPAVSSTRTGLIALADAATQAVFATVARNPAWDSGKVRLRLLYTGDTSSTNGLRIELRLSAFALGDSLDSPSETETETVTLAGPATAEDLLEYESPLELDVTSAHEGVALALWRRGTDAADTYAGEMWVWMVVLEYLPNE